MNSSLMTMHFFVFLKFWKTEEVKKMTEERKMELLANHVQHLEECCSDRKEAAYILMHSIGWAQEELEDLGFEYLFEEDKDNE